MRTGAFPSFQVDPLTNMYTLPFVVFGMAVCVLHSGQACHCLPPDDMYAGYCYEVKYNRFVRPVLIGLVRFFLLKHDIFINFPNFLLRKGESL